MKPAPAVVMQYAEEYPGKYLLLVGLPAGYGSGPLYEELLYRGVLLLLFDGVNVFAFIGIVISAVVFGSLHWKGNLFSGIHPNEWWGLKWLRVVFTGILGFLAGLAIVSWQSFWYAYLIHAVWNFVFPLLTVVCLAIFSLIRLAFVRPDDVADGVGNGVFGSTCAALFAAFFCSCYGRLSRVVTFTIQPHVFYQCRGCGAPLDVCS